jgi:hypothetical protein
MKIFRFLILPLCLGLLLMGVSAKITPIDAQEATTWFWATTPDGIVAYNPDGQVNLLVESLQFLNATLSGYRFGPDSALLQDDENFYWVTSDSARKFSIDWRIGDYSLQPTDFRSPYVLMSTPQTTVASVILNLRNFRVTPLAGNAILPRYLPDGETLRYITYQRENSQIIGTTLWEIDLATGYQTILHEHAGRPNVMYSTPDGLQWWLVYNFRPSDPTVAEVVTIGDPNPEYTEWIAAGTAHISDEWLFHVLPCPDQCTTEAYLLSQTPHLRFELPTNQVIFRNLYHFPDDSLWLSTYSKDILLDPTGKAIDLGEVRSFSRDGRWAVAYSPSNSFLEFPYEFHIWYLPYRAIMFELQIDWFIADIQFFENTVFVSVEDRDFIPEKYGSHIVAWRDYDSPTGGANVTFPDLPGTFFQPVHDGNILYVAPEFGIYLYSASQNVLTELVPQAQPITLDELQ